MKSWLVTALLFLLAVPFHVYWQDYEVARRGLLAALVGLTILVPGTIPLKVPGAVLPFNLLALWYLARSLYVANVGYALETTCHLLALSALVIFGTGMPRRVVLRSTLPAGAIVAGLGIAQGLGYLLLPDTTEAVSTMGNRNFASELIAVCGAAAALLASEADAPRRDRIFGLATLFLCAVAVVLNGSRSGMIALPVGCLPCLFAGAGQPTRGLLACGTAALGMALGLAALPKAEDTPFRQVAGRHVEIPSTVDVRLAIWRSGLEMVKARPLLGHGSGQFQIEYPPFRSQEEIELSSRERRFPTSPAAAHNDYLQVLIEGGIPGLLLALLAAFVFLRRTPFRLWGPLLAFGVLAGVRAPLGNAPVAAIVFLYSGTLLGRAHVDGAPTFSFAPRRQFVKAIVFGGLMLWFGGGAFLSQMASTGYVEQMRRRDDFAALLASIDQALWFRPFDHNLRFARTAKELEQTATLPAAREDLQYLTRIAPHHIDIQLRYAELLRAEGQTNPALEQLQKILVQDPNELRAILQRAEIAVQIGESPKAILALYATKHPRMRERLAPLFGQLAAAASSLGLQDDAELLRVEQSFLETVDLMRANPTSIATRQSFAKFWKRLSKHEQNDMRPLVLAAAQALALDDRAQAEVLAGTAKNRKLLPTHLDLMWDVVQPLLEIPEWRELLHRD